MADDLAVGLHASLVLYVAHATSLCRPEAADPSWAQD